MSYTIDDNWADLPASGNGAYLPGQGEAHDSYRAWRMARNANYLWAARTPQVLASGNNNTDYGTLASVSTDAWMIETAATGVYFLRHRARALVWPPHHSVDLKMAFKATEGSAGKVRLYACDEPISDDLYTLPSNYAMGEVTTIGADFTTAHSLTVSDAPVAADGMIYLYVGLSDIAKFGSWAIWREAISL